MEPRERFAINLRKARQKSKVSQEELGFRCELHRTEISLLERGGREPRMGTILKLAGALDTTAEQLCDGVRWIPGKKGKRGRFQINKK